MVKLFIAAVVFISANAFAEKCMISVTREACPGQEKESYAKCDGNAVCKPKEVEAKTEKECAKKATKECENARVEITKSKTVTATFGEKATPVEGGKNFCAADRSDFNGCKK